jgi:uncharacterized membrane protein YfcA
MLILFFFIYLLIGALAGFCAGLFGIGGGIILVPVLVMVLPHVGIPKDVVFQVSVATSLASVILTSSIAAYTQWKRENVEWSVVKKTVLPLIIASITAPILSHFINGDALKIIFCILLFFIAVRMFYTSSHQHVEKPFPNIVLFSVVSYILAFCSSLVGLGGGVLFVPYLHYCGLPMLRSIGTGSANTLIIASVSTLSYAMIGILGHVSLPHSLGYIYLPGFLGIILTSIFFARLGVRCAHSLPVANLKKGFALLLVLISAKMLF